MDAVIECITLLRKQKKRPSLEHIFRMMRSKSFTNISQNEILDILNDGLKNGKILKFESKGMTSYKISTSPRKNLVNNVKSQKELETILPFENQLNNPDKLTKHKIDDLNFNGNSYLVKKIKLLNVKSENRSSHIADSLFKSNSENVEIRTFILDFLLESKGTVDQILNSINNKYNKKITNSQIHKSCQSLLNSGEIRMQKNYFYIPSKNFLRNKFDSSNEKKVADVCEICSADGSKEKILGCHNCHYKAHAICMKITHTETLMDWLCFNCKKCSICYKRISHDKSELLLCDLCNDGFHATCYQHVHASKKKQLCPKCHLKNNSQVDEKLNNHRRSSRSESDWIVGSSSDINHKININASQEISSHVVTTSLKFTTSKDNLKHIDAKSLPSMEIDCNVSSTQNESDGSYKSKQSHHESDSLEDALSHYFTPSSHKRTRGCNLPLLRDFITPVNYLSSKKISDKEIKQKFSLEKNRKYIKKKFTNSVNYMKNKSINNNRISDKNVSINLRKLQISKFDSDSELTSKNCISNLPKLKNNIQDNLNKVISMDDKLINNDDIIPLIKKRKRANQLDSLNDHLTNFFSANNDKRERAQKPKFFGCSVYSLDIEETRRTKNKNSSSEQYVTDKTVSKNNLNKGNLNKKDAIKCKNKIKQQEKNIIKEISGASLKELIKKNDVKRINKKKLFYNKTINNSVSKLINHNIYNDNKTNDNEYVHKKMNKRIHKHANDNSNEDSKKLKSIKSKNEIDEEESFKDKNLFTTFEQMVHKMKANEMNQLSEAIIEEGCNNEIFANYITITNSPEINCKSDNLCKNTLILNSLTDVHVNFIQKDDECDENKEEMIDNEVNKLTFVYRDIENSYTNSKETNSSRESSDMLINSNSEDHDIIEKEPDDKLIEHKNYLNEDYHNRDNICGDKNVNIEKDTDDNNLSKFYISTKKISDQISQMDFKIDKKALQKDANININITESLENYFEGPIKIPNDIIHNTSFSEDDDDDADDDNYGSGLGQDNYDDNKFGCKSSSTNDNNVNIEHIGCNNESNVSHEHEPLYSNDNHLAEITPLVEINRDDIDSHLKDQNILLLNKSDHSNNIEPLININSNSLNVDSITSYNKNSSNQPNNKNRNSDETNPSEAEDNMEKIENNDMESQNIINNNLYNENNEIQSVSDEESFIRKQSNNESINSEQMYGTTSHSFKDDSFDAFNPRSNHNDNSSSSSNREFNEFRPFNKISNNYEYYKRNEINIVANNNSEENLCNFNQLEGQLNRCESHETIMSSNYNMDFRQGERNLTLESLNKTNQQSKGILIFNDIENSKLKDKKQLNFDKFLDEYKNSEQNEHTNNQISNTKNNTLKSHLELNMISKNSNNSDIEIKNKNPELIAALQFDAHRTHKSDLYLMSHFTKSNEYIAPNNNITEDISLPEKIATKSKEKKRKRNIKVEAKFIEENPAQFLQSNIPYNYTIPPLSYSHTTFGSQIDPQFQCAQKINRNINDSQMSNGHRLDWIASEESIYHRYKGLSYSEMLQAVHQQSLKQKENPQSINPHLTDPNLFFMYQNFNNFMGNNSNSMYANEQYKKQSMVSPSFIYGSDYVNQSNARSQFDLTPPIQPNQSEFREPSYSLAPKMQSDFRNVYSSNISVNDSFNMGMYMKDAPIRSPNYSQNIGNYDPVVSSAVPTDASTRCFSPSLNMSRHYINRPMTANHVMMSESGSSYMKGRETPNILLNNYNVSTSQPLHHPPRNYFNNY